MPLTFATISQRGRRNSEMRQYQILVQYQYLLKFHFHYQDIIPEKKIKINGRCSHLGSAASFVQNQRHAYKLVDMHILSLQGICFICFEDCAYITLAVAEIISSSSDFKYNRPLNLRAQI